MQDMCKIQDSVSYLPVKISQRMPNWRSGQTISVGSGQRRQRKFDFLPSLIIMSLVDENSMKMNTSQLVLFSI